MNVDTGDLFASLEEARRRGLDLRQFIIIPGPLLPEAAATLAGLDHVKVDLKTDTPLARWAERERKKARTSLRAQRRERKHKRQVAASTRKRQQR